MKESELIDKIGSLTANLIKCRESKGKDDRIAFVLRSTPGDDSHTGLLGGNSESLNVIAHTPKDQRFELAGEGRAGSNYAHEGSRSWTFGSEELLALKDQPVVVQLAYLLQVYGKPLKVVAEYEYYNNWQGSDSEEPEEWEVEFTFP